MNRVGPLAALVLCLLGCAHAIHQVPTLADARRGIREGYRRNRAAFLAKDVKAVMALRTDDFHAIGPDGKLLDRPTMEAYISGFINGVERWIELSEKIQSL